MFSLKNGDDRATAPPNARDTFGDARLSSMPAEHGRAWPDTRIHPESRMPYVRDVRNDRDRGGRVTGKRAWGERGSFGRGSLPSLNGGTHEPPHKRRPPGIPAHNENGRFGGGIRVPENGVPLGVSDSPTLGRKFERDPFFYAGGGIQSGPSFGPPGPDVRSKDVEERRLFGRDGFVGAHEGRDGLNGLEGPMPRGFHSQAFSDGESVRERDRQGRPKDLGVSGWDLPPRDRDNRRFKSETYSRMGSFSGPAFTVSNEVPREWCSSEKEHEGRIERYGRESGRDGSWGADSHLSVGREQGPRWRSLTSRDRLPGGSLSETLWGNSPQPATAAHSMGSREQASSTNSNSREAPPVSLPLPAPLAGPSTSVRGESTSHLSPPRRTRLGWGQGLAKYEKKKVEPGSQGGTNQESEGPSNGPVLSPTGSGGNAGPESPTRPSPGSYFPAAVSVASHSPEKDGADAPSAVCTFQPTLTVSAGKVDKSISRSPRLHLASPRQENRVDESFHSISSPKTSLGSPTCGTNGKAAAGPMIQASEEGLKFSPQGILSSLLHSPVKSNSQVKSDCQGTTALAAVDSLQNRDTNKRELVQEICDEGNEGAKVISVGKRDEVSLPLEDTEVPYVDIENAELLPGGHSSSEEASILANEQQTDALPVGATREQNDDIPPLEIHSPLKLTSREKVLTSFSALPSPACAGERQTLATTSFDLLQEGAMAERPAGSGMELAVSEVRLSPAPLNDSVSVERNVDLAPVCQGGASVPQRDDSLKEDFSAMELVGALNCSVDGPFFIPAQPAHSQGGTAGLDDQQAKAYPDGDHVASVADTVPPKEVVGKESVVTSPSSLPVKEESTPEVPGASEPDETTGPVNILPCCDLGKVVESSFQLGIDTPAMTMEANAADEALPEGMDMVAGDKSISETSLPPGGEAVEGKVSDANRLLPVLTFSEGNFNALSSGVAPAHPVVARSPDDDKFEEQLFETGEDLSKVAPAASEEVVMAADQENVKWSSWSKEVILQRMEKVEAEIDLVEKELSLLRHQDASELRQEVPRAEVMVVPGLEIPQLSPELREEVASAERPEVVPAVAEDDSIEKAVAHSPAACPGMNVNTAQHVGDHSSEPVALDILKGSEPPQGDKGKGETEVAEAVKGNEMPAENLDLLPLPPPAGTSQCIFNPPANLPSGNAPLASAAMAIVLPKLEVETTPVAMPVPALVKPEHVDYLEIENRVVPPIKSGDDKVELQLLKEGEQCKRWPEDSALPSFPADKSSSVDAATVMEEAPLESACKQDEKQRLRMAGALAEGSRWLLVSETLTNNFKKSRQAHASLEHLLPGSSQLGSHCLYMSPQEAPRWQQNKASYLANAALLQSVLGQQLRELTLVEHCLSLKYRALREVWRAELQRAACSPPSVALASGGLGSTVTALQEALGSGAGGPGAGVAGSIGASGNVVASGMGGASTSSGSLRRDRTPKERLISKQPSDRNGVIHSTGTLRSSLRQRPSMLASGNMESEEVVETMRRLMEEAPVEQGAVLRMPAMILSHRDRERQRFVSRNGLVEDPIALEEERKLINPWTSEERRIFLEKYALHNKNFALIASFLPHKTVADCVEFYYRNQKSEEFERIRRRQQLKKRRDFSRGASYLATTSSAAQRNREASVARVHRLAVAAAVAAKQNPLRPPRSLDQPREGFASLPPLLAAATIAASSLQEKRSRRGPCRQVAIAAAPTLSEEEGASDGAEDVLPDSKETWAALPAAADKGPEAVPYAPATTGAAAAPPTEEPASPSTGSGRSGRRAARGAAMAATAAALAMVRSNSLDEDCSAGGEGRGPPKPSHLGSFFVTRAEESTDVSWSPTELQRFIDAVAGFKRDFERVSAHVGSRSAAQCQAFYGRMRKQLGLDALVAGSQARSPTWSSAASERSAGELADHVKREPEGRSGLPALGMPITAVAQRSARIEEPAQRDGQGVRSVHTALLPSPPPTTSAAAAAPGEEQAWGGGHMRRLDGAQQGVQAVEDSGAEEQGREDDGGEARPGGAQQGSQNSAEAAVAALLGFGKKALQQGHLQEPGPRKTRVEEEPPAEKVLVPLPSRQRNKQSRESEPGSAPAPADAATVPEPAVEGTRLRDPVSGVTEAGPPNSGKQGKEKEKERQGKGAGEGGRQRREAASWMPAEKERFADIVGRSGRDWVQLQEAIPGKSLAQIKTYFQNSKSKLGLPPGSDRGASAGGGGRGGGRKRKVEEPEGAAGAAVSAAAGSTSSGAAQSVQEGLDDAVTKLGEPGPGTVPSVQARSGGGSPGLPNSSLGPAMMASGMLPLASNMGFTGSRRQSGLGNGQSFSGELPGMGVSASQPFPQQQGPDLSSGDFHQQQVERNTLEMQMMLLRDRRHTGALSSGSNFPPLQRAHSGALQPFSVNVNSPRMTQSLGSADELTEAARDCSSAMASGTKSQRELHAQLKATREETNSGNAQPQAQSQQQRQPSPVVPDVKLFGQSLLQQPAPSQQQQLQGEAPVAHSHRPATSDPLANELPGGTLPEKSSHGMCLQGEFSAGLPWGGLHRNESAAFSWSNSHPLSLGHGEGNGGNWQDQSSIQDKLAMLTERLSCKQSSLAAVRAGEGPVPRDSVKEESSLQNHSQPGGLANGVAHHAKQEAEMKRADAGEPGPGRLESSAGFVEYGVLGSRPAGNPSQVPMLGSRARPSLMMNAYMAYGQDAPDLQSVSSNRAQPCVGDLGGWEGAYHDHMSGSGELVGKSQLSSLHRLPSQGPTGEEEQARRGQFESVYHHQESVIRLPPSSLQSPSPWGGRPAEDSIQSESQWAMVVAAAMQNHSIPSNDSRLPIERQENEQKHSDGHSP